MCKQTLSAITMKIIPDTVITIIPQTLTQALISGLYHKQSNKKMIGIITHTQSHNHHYQDNTTHNYTAITIRIITHSHTTITFRIRKHMVTTITTIIIPHNHHYQDNITHFQTTFTVRIIPHTVIQSSCGGFHTQSLSLHQQYSL